MAVAALRPQLAAASEPYLQPLTHGTMRCVMYAPAGSDQQSPHKQDELYVITRGNGRLEREAESVEFGPGDALLVPAGMAHRFTKLTPDFECWAIFWGPSGGDRLDGAALA